MIEVEWWDYDSPQELADAVAGDVGFIIDSAVEARSASLVALPGGDEEAPLLAKLARQSLSWKKVTIIPTDDFIVAVDDERSKIRSIAKSFLPLGARVFPVVSGGAEEYRAAGSAADARLQDLPWPPDLVWLGMGEGGDTAGLFEGPDLHAALDAPKARRAIGVMPEGEGAMARVSLTRSAILGARTLLITIIGQDKHDLLEGAIADGHSSKLPIGRVLAEVEQPIDIHWCA
ncbi:MAG: 6-phosphogluconolactonase [Sphingomicrobium sp.]